MRGDTGERERVEREREGEMVGERGWEERAKGGRGKISIGSFSSAKCTSALLPWLPPPESTCM